MHNYKELLVWQKARILTKEIYLLTALYPPDERFGLISQMRRSAVSIPSNIAEGAGRRTEKDFASFITIANGSAYELETQIWLSKDLEFIDDNKSESALKKVVEIQKMLYAFREKLLK